MATLLDPILAAAVAQLPAIRLEVAGCLSEAERGYLPDPKARSRYAFALSVAEDARYALSCALLNGVKAATKDGMTGIAQLTIRSLVSRYCAASRALYRAAEAVCESEGMEDDGERAGIVWEVPL